ncbi:D-tyrosyl-tRNA(Tyr) deacylase [Desulfacinum hydrothermale DSM 13146]|uniref:D-aminoacyl-tRNA deacylase n=1 Tax=Desulfacinum hydrothermale DSM 13146 TaxID=1121390 RepID=A0A1W1XFZ0_9BACT|nr:D-aminoacyl-tRNA deacylase [Desulfacinum hydrothermale]SMC22498.1 D-tyrosyl-tRNA(Tyr) deacylase [Desulfacinum hydrothermale DSM 13146]
MRAVVQRVSRASVDVDAQTVGAIGAGLLVLVGVGRQDTDRDAHYLADKIVNLRIFADDQGKLNRSVLDINGGVLAVSQFTLWGDCRKGRRPSFVEAAPPERARELFECFVARLRTYPIAVATGRFQETMAVHLTNDGPVTLLVDSSKAF